MVNQPIGNYGLGIFRHFFAVMKSAYISLIIGPRGLGW